MIIIVSVKRSTDCLIKVCNKVIVTRWALALKVAPTALWNRSRVAICCYHCYQRGLRLNQEEAASWEGLPGGQEGCLLVEHPESEESRSHLVLMVGRGVLEALFGSSRVAYLDQSILFKCGRNLVVLT